MTHPAAIIATGVVVAVAAIIAFFTVTSERPRATGYGPHKGPRRRPPSPPPVPPSPPVARRRRRNSPERRSNSQAPAPTSANEQPVTGARVGSPSPHPTHLNSPGSHSNSPASANKQHVPCPNCDESPLIKVNPCNHLSLCNRCFESHIENNGTCPTCGGRIDSCSPPIPSYDKCASCRRFTKLFKFLPCNHSLSLCIRCFEEQNRSYKFCPECYRKIQGSEPRYATSGTCGVCEEFTRFGTFQPCNHASFCRRHASLYLESNGQECSECGRRVIEIV